ncbi:MAG: beta-glucuronidase [Planctomycetota bacterium]|nr:beta-glucuronidase [Planctomycetota bacterium]
MLRTFTQHTVRPVDSLDGLWEFVTEADRNDRARMPQRYNRTMNVPGSWESSPGLETYRGKSWYRRQIPGDQDMAVRLVFGGVSHTATVYVDGKSRHTHHDAFTPWDLLLVGLKDGQHELVLEVDNSFGDHSALHKEDDYHTYGGITRPAEIQLVPEAYIHSVQAVPVRRGNRWALELAVKLANWSRRGHIRRVMVSLAGKHMDLGEVNLQPGGEKVISGTFAAEDVKCWSADQPTLYDLTVMLMDGYEVVDDMVDRVGFREVKVRGRKLTVNGRNVRLRGYNRHEDHPQLGCSLPVEATVRDLELLRDLGCNFVRACHYPNDMRFLDLCDEMGFYVWEDSHGRNVPLGAPGFGEQVHAVTREMIEAHSNHPAIIMWGCLSDCESDSSDGRAMFESVISLIRKLDPTRPVTFAGDRGRRDMCLALVDIVSWNRYDAQGPGNLSQIAAGLKADLKWLHSDDSRGGKGKPVIISEFGADALYGNRSANRTRWSEEYQLTLDEFRRQKLSYEIVKARHLSSQRKYPRKGG